jgi:hypothetical protein
MYDQRHEHLAYRSNLKIVRKESEYQSMVHPNNLFSYLKKS